jgi:hypothetical protein
MTSKTGLYKGENYTGNDCIYPKWGPQMQRREIIPLMCENF